jgi:hypothetical protein
MIESPVLQEFLAENTREAVLRTKRQSIVQVLAARFGTDAFSIRAALDTIRDDERLDDLTKRSATCRDLAALKESLPSMGVSGGDENTL